MPNLRKISYLGLQNLKKSKDFPRVRATCVNKLRHAISIPPVDLISR